MRTLLPSASLLAFLQSCAPAGDAQRTPGTGGNEEDGFAITAAITGQDAIEIAGTFVEVEAMHGRTEWIDAFALVAVPFVDHQGEVQAWEVKIVGPAKDDAGWVMVEVSPFLPPVSAYTTGGPTQAEDLRDAIEEAAGIEPGEDDVEFLWVGPSSAAIRDMTSGVVYHPFFTPALSDYDSEPRIDAILGLDEDQDDLILGMTRSETIAETRTALLDGVTGHWLLDGAISEVGGSDVDGQAATSSVRSGASSISNFTQDMDVWDNGTCYTGCTPLAFGMVAEYHDRYGYPGLVGTDTDNTNTVYTSSTQDADVRAMMVELRDDLGTTCSGASGSTSLSGYPHGIDYFNSRDEGTWSSMYYAGASTAQQATKWLVVQTEVTQWHPFVLGYDVYETGGATGSTNHSAAGYGQQDNAGSASDFICVEKGWYTTSIGQCVSRMTIGNWHVATVSPP